MYIAPKFFKIVYILCIAVAPYLTLETVWILADITNALMAFPNLIALLALSPVVIAETKKFFDEEKENEENKEMKNKSCSIKCVSQNIRI